MNCITLKNKEIEIDKSSEFYSIIKDILENKTVQQMKNFNQHCNTSTYEHCYNVAYISYLICKKLNLDYKSAARAGMLHDFFLYNWRHSSKNLGEFHAFAHPKIEIKKASELFNLNKVEKDIILKHMWPVTLFQIPKYPESFIITLVDKYSAFQETAAYYYSTLTKKEIMKYAYIFLCLLILV